MQDSFINEQCALGSFLILSDLSSDVAQKALSMIRIGSFQDGRHKAIFSALQELERQSTLADLVMVNNCLQKNGKINMVGGIAYLADIMQIVPSAANLLGYCDLVRQKSIEISINTGVQCALAEFNDPDGGNIYQKLGRLETFVSSLGIRANNGRESGLIHIKEVGKIWFDELLDRKENPDHHAGLSTGIETLDKVLGAKKMRKGSLVVVGGRPKVGKTAFLEVIVKSVGLDQKKAVALFTLEMPNLQIYERFLSSTSKVNSDLYHTVDLNEYQFQKTSEAIGIFNESSIFFDDTPSITIEHIKKESRKLSKEQGGLGLIAVDYLTLMKAPKADRNDLSFGLITKELKNLAKELDCVALLLIQLNRGLEQRPDKRPVPSDGRDTGQIEQDCDLWIGLYREGVYNDSLPDNQKGLTEAIVRLNRHGPTGTGYMDMRQGSLVNTMPFSFAQPEKTKRNF